MARKKTIIEEDDEFSSPSSRSSQQTIINEDNGLVWFFGILLIILLWGVIGYQITDNNEVECNFGIDGYFCWFWSANDQDTFNIDVNIENSDSSGNQQSDNNPDSGGLGY